ncbi:hypothetical protein L9F63_014405 [Diploptera punctata]|uniref:receptor protein-tyrosine kinase n=1 Tax=Diploptera punctata TaxID=6984 RepID=A0AAD8ELD9_DIPPU|nr:hypothetical protein L9F63_014405 [Diploptera punctata]
MERILRSILIVICMSVIGHGVDEGSICPSMDIRNKAQALERLSGCRVVEGFVRVVLIDKANETEYEPFTFPELQEITDYLLVYRVTGLTSLGHLFPNLTVIRGNSLFVDYALVVYEMFQLKELGLKSLTTILRGSVRIEKNHVLCYLYTVDWKSVISNGELYAKNNNPENLLCPGCPTTCDSNYCWGRLACQKKNSYGDHICHELCLGGCTGSGPHECSACVRMISDAGVCIANCPRDRFEFMGRRCITEEECRISDVPPAYLQRTLLPGLPSKAWIPFNGSCTLMCPLGYQPVVNNFGKYTCEECVGYCRKVCGSGHHIPIESIYHIQNLNGCTYINGSLIIRLFMGTQAVEELEKNFDGIEEISGFLKIYYSFPLTTLNFFKRLRIIRGLELECDQFALVIVGNDNLQELWNWDLKPKNFTIERGTLSIHSNPKLCMSEIDTFRDISGFRNDSAVEISQESNGNNMACKPVKMNVSSRIINSTYVEISWKSFDTFIGRGTLLGYTVHYAEAINENSTYLEDKDNDECENNKWRVAYVVLNSQSDIPTNMSYVISRLKPFTRYAFYVKTYSTALATVGGRSSIQYFRTFPDRPSIPRYLRAYANSSSEMIVHWQPPLFPNGEISHYFIVGWRHYDDSNLLEQRDYCQFPLQSNKKVEEEQFISNQPNIKKACGNKRAPEACLSNDDSRFNFIYTQEAINEEQESCDQETSIYSVLYSHRLYGNGGGIYDSYDFAYSQFEQRTEGNSTNAILRDLQHFAEYTIKVVACRKDRYGNIDHKWNDKRCSPASLITARTQKLENADQINSSFVKISIESTTVRVFWLEPLNPNGIIVAYNVKYKRTDITNYKPATICLTKLQFEKTNNWFVLNNMHPGKYCLRLKAVSLAGRGKSTDCIEFTVMHDTILYSRKTEIIILTVIITMLLILIFGALFYWGKKIKAESEATKTIITSVNPDYAIIPTYQPDEWEIVRDKVEIVKELSRGTFGIVYEGILYPANIHCAVKTVDEKATARERIEFLNEASIMKSFTGGHHVVRLFGVVSRGQPPLVIMELMSIGDLKSFLREARNEVPHRITLSRVLLMAAQIADGMAYLEANKFVHRDLAARNCMISKNYTVKIGDFGMTRDIYHSDYYRKGNKGLLPVRWMAPESLADGVFTNQSDVWSFGIVLWEIATLAEQPYQGLSNEQVLQYVLRGGLLDKPISCPEILYSLMLACWQKKPVHRPTFFNLVRVLDAVTDLGDEFRQVSFYHSQKSHDLSSACCQTSSPDYANSDLWETSKRLDSSILSDGFHTDNNTIREIATSNHTEFQRKRQISIGSQYLDMSKVSKEITDEHVLG